MDRDEEGGGDLSASKPCVMCDRAIDPRDVADCYCYGCGAYICKLCTHRIVWEFGADPVGGPGHFRGHHAAQAKKLGIEKAVPNV